MDIKFEFINSPKKVTLICNDLKEEKIIGVDLECENNLHYYGVRVTLIQISTENKNYIFDAIALRNLDELMDIFRDEKIMKIFHDVSFDLRMLNYCYNCLPKNIYDTQLASAFLGRTQLGLGQLLEEYFHVKKESKFQMADWVKRPISNDMLQYAIKDTIYLIPLKKILDKELFNKKKLDWVYEEFKNFEVKDWSYHQGDFLDIRGMKQISDSERGIAKELFDLREKLAELVNRPTHFILSNKRLIEIAIKPIKEVKKWNEMKGVHPIVRAKAKEFVKAIIEGSKKKIYLEKVKKRKYNSEEIARFTCINEIKDKLAEKFQIAKHLILDKEDAKNYALSGNLDFLSNWQKEIIQEELKK